MEIFKAIIYCIIYPAWTSITVFAWVSYLVVKDDCGDPYDKELNRNILMDCIILTIIDILLAIGLMKNFL